MTRPSRPAARSPSTTPTGRINCGWSTSWTGVHGDPAEAPSSAPELRRNGRRGMTRYTTNDQDESEANLALIAGKLLAAMPPRMPQRLDSPSGCGWCGDEGVHGQGDTDGRLHREADPVAWVLHVLREHLRGLLAASRVKVEFNGAGGATVVLHDAYAEDVVLFRDALGVQLSCVLEFET